MVDDDEWITQKQCVLVMVLISGTCGGFGPAKGVSWQVRNVILNHLLRGC